VLFVQRGDAIVVSEVQPGSQAEVCGLILPGDVLKRTSAVFGDELWEASDFRRTMCVRAWRARAHATAVGPQLRRFYPLSTWGYYVFRHCFVRRR
jgi:hypothetical protein